MIDLHMHSRYSDDGEYTPEELVTKCFEHGIQVMSVTDHNCALANGEAKAAAVKKGMTYLSGIEIDCVYEGANFHMLGYDFDEKSQDFVEIERNIERQGQSASLEMLAKTNALGFQVTKEEMQAIAKDSYWPSSWTGEQFAEVLLHKPDYADHALLRPYRTGGNRSDNPYVNIYWDFYAQGKPCHSAVSYPQAADVIGILHRNHGIAVLAHPGINLAHKEHLLDGLLSLGIDGIEAFSSYHTEAQAAFFYEEALKNKLLVTCGSDYHGKTKPAISPGQHHCFLSDGDLIRLLRQKLRV